MKKVTKKWIIIGSLLTIGAILIAIEWVWVGIFGVIISIILSCAALGIIGLFFLLFNLHNIG